jgi:type II secretory pathway pseudopilin PulG
MRRRFSLVLLAVLVVVAVYVSTNWLSHRTRGINRVASTSVARDSLARLDSAARAESREDADTMCFASRIGLPCDPR